MAAAADERQQRKAVRRFNKVPADPKTEVLSNLIIRQTTESTTNNGSGDNKSLPLGFLCKFCCEIFELPEFLDEHLTTLHNKSRLNNIQQINVADGEVKFSDKTATDLNGGGMKSSSSSNNGLRTSKSSSSSATSGHKVRSATSGANYNVNRPKKAWYPCPHCEHAAKTSGNLNVHVAAIHERRKYKCDQCETVYSSRSSLWRHVMIHHDDNDGNDAADRRQKGRKRHLLTEQHNNNNDSNDKLKVDHNDDHDQQHSSSSSSKKRRA